MQIEYKTVGVTGVRDTSMQDGPGVVTAIVSVTGIRDNVGDVIEPGAYAESLREIKPKGAWGHDWQVPVSKALDVAELMPGDPRLPAKLPNGQDWPKKAGALWVKMQFNLDTQRGRDAHSDVLFFAEDQEWSIGYKVPEGGARHEKSIDGPTRYISRLKCYEYSPVLFGAMPSARTASVKDAQISFKSLMGVDLGEWMAEFEEHKRAAGFGLETKNSSSGSSAYRYEDDDEEDIDLDDEEKSMLMQLGIEPGELRSAITVMTKVLNFLDGRKDGGGEGSVGVVDNPVESVDDAADVAAIELDALNYDTTTDALAAVLGLDDTQRATLEKLAAQFDAAEGDEDREALLDAIGAELEDTDGETFDGLRVTARVAGDMMESVDGEKSSRFFGPEYKELAQITGRRARHEAYLLQLKAARPEVLDALYDTYPAGSGLRALIGEVKTGRSTASNGFVIDLKALEELAKVD